MSQRTSCISFPRRSRYIMLREPLIHICQQHSLPNCAAMLLAHMIYITDNRIEANEQLEVRNQEDIQEGRFPSQDITLWIPVKIETWVSAVMGEYKRDAVMAALDFLNRKGLIRKRERKPSQNEDTGLFKGRANEYWLNADLVQGLVNALPADLPAVGSRQIDSGKTGSSSTKRAKKDGSRQIDSGNAESIDRLHIREELYEETTRSESDSSPSGQAGGLPSVAIAPSVDPQTGMTGVFDSDESENGESLSSLDSQKTVIQGRAKDKSKRITSLPSISAEEKRRLRGEIQSPDRAGTTQKEVQAQEDLAPVKTPQKPAAPVFAPASPSLLARKKQAAQEQGDTAGDKPRAIFQSLADLLGRALTTQEQKNLCQRRELEWRGRMTVAAAAADLWDKDERFREYAKWMIEQAKTADIHTKTIVPMLRNYNRGDASAPGKIAGWWLWDEQHPRPAAQAHVAAADPASVDWNGPWVFDQAAVPPFQEVYVSAWKLIRNEQGDPVWRWIRIAKVADLPEEKRKQYFIDLAENGYPIKGE